MARKTADKRPRLAIVVSDLHVGSDYAVMPRGFRDKSGRPIGLNPIQEWFHKIWSSCCKWVDTLAAGDPWVLVINGDVIDGYHHGTKELMNHDESDHRSAAGLLLSPLCNKAHTCYMVDGTESHTKGHEHTLVSELEQMGAKFRKPEIGRAYGMLRIQIGGTLCHFAHHIGTTARPYLESSALAINLGVERIERQRAGHRVPGVVVRSHRHKYGLFSDGYGMVVTTPSWQSLTRFARKVVTGAVGQYGMVALDWRNRQDGALPDVHECLYTAPEEVVEVLS